MTYFFKKGSIYNVMSEDAIDLSETLPKGFYTVLFNSMTNSFYLETINEFSLPSKLYGNTQELGKRVLNTFKDRTQSTGVLLIGEKGSGKTLLSKYIAITSGLPVLVINNPYHGDEFGKFLASIEQQCVIIFDEFEKVYDYEDQNKILTIFDGVYSSKKLFIITSNRQRNLSQYIINRPSRFYYKIIYDNVSEEFIREYCEDNLHDKNHLEKLIDISKIYEKFNFDMLKTFIEEMNRYNETPNQVLKYINCTSNYDVEREYIVELTSSDPTIKLQTTKWYGSIYNTTRPLCIEYTFTENSNNSNDEDDAHVSLTPANIISLKQGKVVYNKFQDDIKFEITLTEVQPKHFNPWLL